MVATPQEFSDSSFQVRTLRTGRVSCGDYGVVIGTPWPISEDQLLTTVETEMAKSKDGKLRAYCNQCASETAHRICAKKEFFAERDDTGKIMFQYATEEEFVQNHIDIHGHDQYIGWDDVAEYLEEYFIVQCLGCSDVHFMLNTWQSESCLDSGQQKIYEYPPRLARPFPSWLKEIEKTLQRILEETYTALQNGSPALATMGARAALEHLMLLRIPDQGRFEANVDEFIRQGYLQPQLKQSLMEALEVGHAAIHRGYAPADALLSDLFDVLEGIINSTLVLPEKASNVQKVTPMRQIRRNPENPKQ